MIGHLAEMSARFESLSPARLSAVAEQLHKYGVVSDSSLMRLKNDIQTGSIESAFDLNKYLKLDRVFYEAEHSGDPSTWLERVLREIAAILPGIQFSNFSYTVEPDTEKSKGGLKFVKYVITLTCNGQIYKYASSADIFKNKENKTFTDFILPDFYRIFNKVLTDQQSPYRFHNLQFTPGASNNSIKDFAIIALKENQVRVFWEKPCISFMMASMDNYDNTLTSKRIDTTITEWEKAGLFEHLSAFEIKSSRNRAEADQIFNIDNLLINFPGIMFTRDSMFTSQDPVYVSMLQHLALITHGKFNPTHITQKKVNGKIRLQYLAKGKIHTHTFGTANGWFDAGFAIFLKSLAAENTLSGDFYTLQDEGVIFLTKEQYLYIADHKLLDLNRSSKHK